MHGLPACLFKYLTVAAFMLSTVKMPLKGEVGGNVLCSHGNYIDQMIMENHGKIMELRF